MNSKQYVGKRVSSLEEYDSVGPITGIALVIDDNNEYLAGDQNGYVLEVECPYGTQTMANNMLANIKGQIYKGYRAENAIMKPEAELGDGVTIAGTYSMLAYRSVKFGPGHMSEIAAPGENELNHEYQYISPTQRKIERKIAQTRSSITKTAEQIRLEVANEIKGLSSSFTVQLDSIESKVTGLNGQMSSITQTVDSITQRVQGLDGKYAEVRLTLDGLTVTDQSGTTRIKGSSIETGSIAAESITADKLNLTGSITWGDLDSYSQTQITSASQTAASAYNLAYANQLPSYIKSTYIDSTTVMAPSISGGSVTGGTLVGAEIYFGGTGAAGNLNYTTGDDGQSTTDLIQLGSTSGIEIVASTNIRISPGKRIFLDVDIDDLRVRSGGNWVSIRAALAE